MFSHFTLEGQKVTEKEEQTTVPRRSTLGVKYLGAELYSVSSYDSPLGGLVVNRFWALVKEEMISSLHPI